MVVVIVEIGWGTRHGRYRRRHVGLGHHVGTDHGHMHSGSLGTWDRKGRSSIGIDHHGNHHHYLFGLWRLIEHDFLEFGCRFFSSFLRLFQLLLKTLNLYFITFVGLP